MIDLVQTKRSLDETCDDIAREREQYAEAIDAFHRIFYASKQTHGLSFYQGVPILKNPLDLWVAQEIIWDLKPTLIIETGTAHGASALYYAHQLDRVGGPGHVVSIDLEPAEALPKHARVSYVRGSSVRPDIVAALEGVAKEHPRVMVVLDSDHAARHVYAEMEAYGPLVTPGQFLVVEDTNINGRPIPIQWKNGPGPGVAVDEWLPDHPEFERALMAERYLMTFHTWLRRALTE